VRGVVTFRIGPSRYGLPAELVCEVIEPGPLKRGIPSGGERRVDLARVRGRWLPIAELEEIHSEDRRSDEAALLLVLGRGRGRIGLLVDELGEVISEGAASAGHAEGMIELGGEMIRIVDAEVLLASSGKLFEEAEELMDTDHRTAEPRRVVAFKVGGEEFGLDVMNVLEVLRVPPVREVPRAPEFVEGLVDVRDAVIPVIDVRARFGVTAREDEGGEERLLVSEGTHGRVGLVVDDVAGVVALPEEAISSPPEFFKGLAGRYLKGIARSGERLIIVLDIDEILSSQERIELQRMLESVVENTVDDGGADRPEGGGAAPGSRARKKAVGGEKKRASRGKKSED
jgi:purine-binding chemotaxis protein CheW